MNRFKAAWNALTVRSYDSSATNLFGSISRSGIPIPTKMGFIPDGFNGETIDLTGNNVNPQWLGLGSKMMQYWAYRYCAPLAGVIDRLAEADTNGRLEVIDSDGIVRKNISSVPKLYRVTNLINNPNPLQTWEEHNSQQDVLAKTFGYCPVFTLSPFGMDKSYSSMMINLNPFYWTPTKNDDYDLHSDDPIKSNPIKEWHGNYFGHTFVIPAKDVMVIKDGFIDSDNPQMGLPQSKVAGLDYFISNICAAMEADNVLLKKKGPLGVFSYDPKPDMAGWTPMKPKDQSDIQDDLKRYGMTWAQLQYIVSKVPIKWNAMSFNVQELMTKETVRQGIEGICDRMGFPAELMSGKNATYENRNSAEKFLYQNNIIPYSLRKMKRYDKFFGVSGLHMDFNHLPVIQEDILKAGQAKEAQSNGLTLDWENGMITRNEYRTRIDLDTVADGEMYYADYILKYPNTVKNAGTTPKDTGAKK